MQMDKINQNNQKYFFFFRKITLLTAFIALTQRITPKNFRIPKKQKMPINNNLALLLHFNLFFFYFYIFQLFYVART